MHHSNEMLSDVYFPLTYASLDDPSISDDLLSDDL